MKRFASRKSNFQRAVAIIRSEDDEKSIKSTILGLLNTEPGIIHETDEKGFSLLHHAVRQGEYALVCPLLEHGANPNAVTLTGRSPLGLCGRFEDEDQACRKLLIHKGAKLTPWEQVTEFIRTGDEDGALNLLKRHPDLIKAGDPFWGSYLHAAARLGTGVKVLEHLLAHGLDPNVRNDEAETPLHAAFKNPAAVRILLEHGADIDSRDDQDYTPLHRALAHNSGDQTAIMLVEAGADVNPRTNEGETPLDFVYEMRYPGWNEMAHYLKSKGAKRGKRKKS